MEPEERSEEEDERPTAGGSPPRETPLRRPGEAEDGSRSEEEEEGDTSDSGSSNSSSSTSGSSSSSGLAGRSPPGAGDIGEDAGGTLMKTDEFGDHFHVNCAGNAAKFYLNRFARGSIGRCVLFRSRWITPNEFQAISGRQSSKDWKRSIRLRGRCLKEYITQGLFQEHLKTCACKICSGETGEQLRLEGEMALAAKRRRLSQADGSSSTAGQSSTMAEGVVQELAQSPTHSALPLAKRKKGKSGRVHRVWSPSGEVAQEMSEEEEEEEDGDGNDPDSGGRESENGYKVEDEETREKLQTPLTDSSFELHRRSQRSAMRKHAGYRTELGTFPRRPRDWNTDEVADFLTVHGFGHFSQQFQAGEVDGESMFLLKEHHLVGQFGLKLGPALKLLDTISRLRHPPP